MRLLQPERTASKKRRYPTSIPQDVRKAIDFMRLRITDPLTMTMLSEHCGVAERTLNEHFRTFLGLSPMAYHRRLRLAAAREALLSGGPANSVTEVAKLYQFNHAGRFSGLYRGRFGETPSRTLQRGRAKARRQVGETWSGNGGSDTGRPAHHLLGTIRDKPSVAVLPVASAAGDPLDRWLGAAVAEGIAEELSSSHALDVMIPTSAQAATYSAQRLAREMGARYLLKGRVVRQGIRVRLILRLLDAETGRLIWADSLEGQRDQPLELQDRVITGILGNLNRSIHRAELERASRAAPENMDAYGLAMRALAFLYPSTPPATRRALEILHRAMELEPDYGLATALAAWGHAQLVMYNGTRTPNTDSFQVKRLIGAAAILETDDPLALTARCAAHMATREFDVAEALVTRAVALDPSCGWAWSRSGWLHSYLGNSETSIEHFRRALTLGPDSTRANVFAGIGSAHFNVGRYAAAASWVRRAIREQPGMVWANRSLSVSYARLGEPLLARKSLDALRRSCPDLTVSQVATALPFKPGFIDRLSNGLSELGLPA